MIIAKDRIISRKNPIVMRAASLSDKKGREETGLFMAEGVKLFSEAAGAGLPIDSVLVDEEKIDSLLPLLKNELSAKIYEKTVIYLLSKSCFEKISTEKSPQGVIVIIKYLDFFKRCTKIIEEEFLNRDKKYSIILSSMRDPGNLGSVIRSAVAFGAERIIISDDCADIYNPKTIRAAMGSLFKVEILISDDLCRTVSALRAGGRRVFAAELRENAVSLEDIDLCKSDIMIIGNEGHGISEELSSSCDGSVYIPISSRSESLNAAVAASIFIREQKFL